MTIVSILKKAGLILILTCEASPIQMNDKGPDQKLIDKAVAKGCKFLMRSIRSRTPNISHGTLGFRDSELILLTLIHGGYTIKNETVAELLDEVLSQPLTATYNVAIQATLLTKLNPVKYRGRLIECAQYLIDSQCENGQWSYTGKANVPRRSKIPTESHQYYKEKISTGNKKAVNGKEVDKFDNLTKIYLLKNPATTKTASGDNSNTQYAALGIAACYKAGIIFPEETLKPALDHWDKTQNDDGGWSYHAFPSKPEFKSSYLSQSYGSMTCAGVSSICIYLSLLNKDCKKDVAVINGLNWLKEKFTVKANPLSTLGIGWQYYYLYGLERTGTLYGTEKIGDNHWYSIGAEYLLKEQNKDGSWLLIDANWFESDVLRTCFAILFLKRATKSLKEPEQHHIETGNRKKESDQTE
ncbi:MAG: terpene cyclase/mutase family protein [Planctomycetes bacterium]|nr:terpene cyclase/mutase family protein [Planctomycetota bacterium]